MLLPPSLLKSGVDAWRVFFEGGDCTFFGWFRWQRSSWCATLHPGITAMRPRIPTTPTTHTTHTPNTDNYCWCKRLLQLFLVAKHLTHLEVFWSKACRCNSWPSLGFIANHPVTNRLRAKKTKSRLIPQLSTGNLFTIGTNKLKLICWDNCINSSLRANYSIS